MSELFMGLDPGKNGGIGIVDLDGKHFASTRIGTNREVLEFLGTNWTSIKIAYLEEVASRPSQSSSAGFSFGMRYGELKMALTACRIPFDLVRPQVWQHRMRCLTHGDKNVSKRKAQELFPDVKMTHMVADALLIAEYARRLHLRLFSPPEKQVTL